jgi:hypothetical protein
MENLILRMPDAEWFSLRIDAERRRGKGGMSESM